jgi:hypothetical protein
LYNYPATDGLYNGQFEYYHNALFVWDASHSICINIPSISFSSAPPAHPIQRQMYYNTAGNSLNVYNGGAWKSAHFAELKSFNWPSKYILWSFI